MQSCKRDLLRPADLGECVGKEGLLVGHTAEGIDERSEHKDGWTGWTDISLLELSKRVNHSTSEETT